jgi:hypothetical protein
VQVEVERVEAVEWDAPKARGEEEKLQGYNGSEERALERRKQRELLPQKQKLFRIEDFFCDELVIGVHAD